MIGKGYDNNSQQNWLLTYANISSDSDTSSWNNYNWYPSFENPESEYSPDWFVFLSNFDVNTRAPLRDVPEYYHQLLEQNGIQGVSGGEESYHLRLAYNSYVEEPNAIAWGSSGNFTFHWDMSVPDVVGHEMTHWLLLAKVFPYDFNEHGVSYAAHEGMADIMGEIVTLIGYDEYDWITGTAIPAVYDLHRDLTVSQIDEECHFFTSFEFVPNDDGVDKQECLDVYNGNTVFDPEIHDVCVYTRKHTFPCPHHIDYETGEHTYDLNPDIHECTDLFENPMDSCPDGLPHEYFSSTFAENYPWGFDQHNWGRILGRVGYLIGQSGIQENNGIFVQGLGPSKTEHLMVETLFSLIRLDEVEMHAVNSIERDWMDGNFVNESERYFEQPPTEWETAWNYVYETMYESCFRLIHEGSQGFSLNDCESVEKAWASVGVGDWDDDGIENTLDNCEYVTNRDQENSDSVTSWGCEVLVSTSPEPRLDLDCSLREMPGDALGDACDQCPNVAARTVSGCSKFVIPPRTAGPVSLPPWTVRLDNPSWSAIGDADGLSFYKHDLSGSTEVATLFDEQAVKELIQQGHYLIVVVENTVAIVDTTDVNRPQIVSVSATRGDISAMRILQDNLSQRILAVTAGDEIHQYQIDDLANPIAFPITEIGGKILDMDEWDGTLFVTHRQGLSVVSTGDSAAVVSFLDIDDASEVEMVAGIPVVKTNNGLLVIDAGEIENPTISQNISLQLPGYSMIVEEGYVRFVVDPQIDIENYCGSDMTVIAGDEGSNMLEGSSESECILGMGGEDVVFAKAGDDTVIGGPGGADIYGGLGDDVIVGTGDDDMLFGNRGGDEIMPHGGFDLIVGGKGPDVIHIYDECEMVPGKLICGGCGFDTLISPFEGCRAYWQLLAQGVFVLGIEHFEGVYADNQGEEQAVCY